ncbi:MAG: tetratricopeptide repeat protein [Candidatus Heimdallarchaeota archaeon]
MDTIQNVMASDITERKVMLLALESGLYSYMGEMERALECVQQGLTLHKQLKRPHMIANSLYYIGFTYLHQGDYKRALEYLQQSLTLREQLGTPQAIAQSLYCLGVTYANIGEMERALEYLQQSLTLREHLGTHYGVAQSLAWLGAVYTNKGELEHALETLQQCLSICEHVRIPGTFVEARAFQYLGIINLQKGEWESSLEYLQKSLSIFQEQGIKLQIGLNRTLIGRLYLHSGNLDAAFQYGLESLKVLEEAGITLFGGFFFAFNLSLLVWISLEQGKMELARRYLHRLKTLRGNVASKVTDLAYRFTQAMVLKVSPRTRDKMRAQELFQQITKDEIISRDYTVLASLNLCELLFFEFKTSEAPEILHEIKTITNRLLDLAKSQYSYSLLAETYLLQAKLALIELDIPHARHLLSQAQVLAEEKGLQKLAMSISYEHDLLLDQLNQWEALRDREPSLADAGALSGVESQLTRMVQQRAVELPPLQPDEPLLLLILTESGISIYSKKFTLGQQLDDQLIGGLLTAINNFGKEVFAGAETDRITYQEYTVVLKALESLLFCYIFKGQSYLALQKLERLIEQVQASPSIWEILKTMMKSDATLKTIEDIGVVGEPGLNQMVLEIFQAESVID